MRSGFRHRRVAIPILLAFILCADVGHIAAQKLTPKEAAKQAQDKAEAATKAANDAQSSADLADNKTEADKAAEKADEQAAKDQQAARDAQEKLDKSNADVAANKPGSAAQQRKEQGDADAAAQKAINSEKAAQKADAKADETSNFTYQSANRKKQREKRKALQDAWVKKRQAEGLSVPSWTASKVISLAPAAKPTGGDTAAALASAGQIKIDSVGTGETIGHIADLKLQNLTDQPMTCTLGPMVLESAGRQSQDYVCPKSQTVHIDPHGIATVPVDGVCINRHKPPVAKGAPGDLIANNGDPNTPQIPGSHISPRDAAKLLVLCNSKYDAADKLLHDGDLKDIPYTDPKKKKDIVVQWSTWSDPQISELTGVPPATKDDLKKVVYKQLEQNGPMSPETKKKVDQGIDNIFEKVELTTAKAKDLESPPGYIQEGLNGAFEVGQDEFTPMPWTGPLPQTKEKPKKKKWPKAIQDWLDKKHAADDADANLKEARRAYDAKRHEFFRKSKHWGELLDKWSQARDKAEQKDATQADKDAFGNAKKELDKFEEELTKDFNKTADGQKEFGKVAEAEKAASEAHTAEEKVGKNIDPNVKKAAEDEAKKAVPAKW